MSYIGQRQNPYVVFLCFQIYWPRYANPTRKKNGNQNLPCHHVNFQLLQTFNGYAEEKKAETHRAGSARKVQCIVGGHKLG